MDAGTAALLGALAGASVTGGLTLLNTLAPNRFQTGQAANGRTKRNEAEKQRDHDSTEQAAQHEHEVAERRQRHAAELLPKRLASIEDWRLEIQNEIYRLANHDPGVNPISDENDLVGRPWIGSLRAHLSDSVDAAAIRDQGSFLTYLEGTEGLTREVARIEQKWTAEALG